MSRPRVEPAIWTEPVRGGYPDPTLFGLSGLEQVRAFFKGWAPPPPIHHLTGMIPTEAGPGMATFVMPATPWLLSPPGHVTLGTLAILADGPLGCAIQTALPPFTAYTTAEISMNAIRPVTDRSGTLISRGRLVFAGRSLALSECMIEDAQGRVIAHGTSRCVIFPPLGPPPPELPDYPVLEPVTYATPDPYLRPAEGSVVPQDVWDRMGGIDVMRAHLAGEIPAPPISHLTGLAPIEVDEGASTFVLPASGWLCSPLAKVEGGAIAMLAETAIAGAVETIVPARTAFAPLDLKVNFLRPVDPDGRELVARGMVIHHGRKIAVATSEVLNEDGKRVAPATGTWMLLPGRPWHPDRPVVQADESS